MRRRGEMDTTQPAAAREMPSIGALVEDETKVHTFDAVTVQEVQELDGHRVGVVNRKEGTEDTKQTVRLGHDEPKGHEFPAGSVLACLTYGAVWRTAEPARWSVDEQEWVDDREKHFWVAWDSGLVTEGETYHELLGAGRRLVEARPTWCPSPRRHRIVADAIKEYLDAMRQ